jgi:hypothetical protein
MQICYCKLTRELYLLMGIFNCAFCMRRYALFHTDLAFYPMHSQNPKLID